MFRLDDDWVFSATDLVTALRCEHELLAKRAEKAGLVEPLEVERDQLAARAAELGIAHEEAVRDQLLVAHGAGAIGRAGGLVAIEAPPPGSARSRYEQAAQETAAAMAGGADVVYQGAFFHEGFYGLADFLVRTVGADGAIRYEPADTKFARHARVEALLQLAAYGHQVHQLGWPAPTWVHLWLGDGTQPRFRYGDLEPVLADRSARVRALLARPAAVPSWEDPTLRRCGWCDHCKAAEEATRDVQLVAGVRVDQRRRLREVGIATVEDLATATERPQLMRDATFEKLQRQARLQVAQDATRTDADPLGVVTAELVHPEGIALIPEPSPGDVFFDFEGDPLYMQAGWPDLGLEYLFGTVVHAPGAGGDQLEYWPLWAHDRGAEHQALETFVDWLVARRAQPGLEGLHVYHYAPYEITALKKLVQRYGTRGDELDELLRDGVFVDLYSVVRRSVQISERSYSIKKLEPLYLTDEQRAGEVTGGAASVVAYAEFRACRDAGDHDGAQRWLASLAEYNRLDCVSTLGLRDWLLSLPGGHRPAPAPASPSAAPAAAPAAPVGSWYAPAAELAEQLLAPIAALAPAARTADEQARAMLSAALLYHRRESLPFWWDHFRRVAAPVEDWEHDGEMVVLDPSSIEVVSDWTMPKQTFCRTLRAEAEVSGTFKLTAGARLHAIYDPPVPPEAQRPANGDRGVHGRITLDELVLDGDRAQVTFTESLPRTVEAGPPAAFDAYPAALSAGAPPEARGAAAAVLALARDAFDAAGELRAHPALDVLRRQPPRLVQGAALAPVGPDGFAPAIAASVRALDRSYLAVQGPPGTGKTTVGAAVIADLVADGWKVGVVAQSHRTIEGMLDKAVRTGLDPSLVVKRAGGGGDHLGTSLDDADLLARVCGEGGLLVGGTTWDFVSDKRVPAGSLDLLVIDEAGQFSLADTLAVSRAAPRLLLLGDPQQLPQVSTALHPEPVDRAALAWLQQGRDTLPPELGYLLDRSYRMHPALAEVCSHLSYDGRLASAPAAGRRAIEGVAPGLVTVLVDHRDNRTSSVEEADQVVALVTDLVGRTWTDPAAGRTPADRPLEPADVLVVAPYNAQVNLLRRWLDDAGFEATAVGTVDKFQGQEAPVVIVSMASSSASSGRGVGFVLSRNRLNVAISRAQHTAYLLHAPTLTDVVPGSPAGLLQLGAFLGASRRGRAASG